MGSPVSVVVAEIVMQQLEEQALSTYSNPIETETEKDGKMIAFLVSMVTRSKNFIQTSVYRKPTSTSRILDNSSYHPISHKSATVAILLRRAYTIRSSS